MADLVLNRWGLTARYGIYLVPALAYLAVPGSPVPAPIVIGGLVLWLVADYAGLRWRSALARPGWAAAMAVVQLAALVWWAAYTRSTLFVFGVYPLIAEFVIDYPRRAWLVVLGAGLAAVASVVALTNPPRVFWIDLAFWIGGYAFTVLTGFSTRLAFLERDRATRLMQQLDAAREELARHMDLRERLAAERERVRLAETLHDTIAHTLTGVYLQLQALRAVGRHSPADLDDALMAASDAVHDTLEEVRRAVRALAEPEGAERSWQATVTELVAKFRALSGVNAEVSCRGDENIGDPDCQLIRRVVREGLTNAARHGQATTIRVTCTVGDDGIAVTVEDDGRGLRSRWTWGMGLSGLREAVGLGGGSVTLRAANPPPGTVLEARWPRNASGTGKEAAHDVVDSGGGGRRPAHSARSAVHDP